MSPIMTRFLALLAFGFLSFGPAQAEPSRPVLVELFASQNCSACPKAHKTMRELTSARDDIFVLTWSVSYWDYLGEPDPLALPKAKVRQAAYAENLELRAPYTPQSVYDGVKQCPGTRKRDVQRNISTRLKAMPEEAPLITQARNGVILSGPCNEALEVTLVEFMTGEDNTTDMVNPVTRTESLGLWTGEEDVFETNCKRDCAVLVHKPEFGEIIAFQRLDAAP